MCFLFSVYYIGDGTNFHIICGDMWQECGSADIYSTIDLTLIDPFDLGWNFVCLDENDICNDTDVKFIFPIINTTCSSQELLASIVHIL